MPQKGDELEIPNVSFAHLLWQRCREREDNDTAEAVIDNSCIGRSMTFLEFHNQSRKCSAFLHNHGVNKGDVIGLVASNSLDYLLTMVGIIGCGAVATPCNPSFKEGEIVRLFTISQPVMLFVEESVIETMKNVQKQLPSIKEIFVIGFHDDFVTLNKIVDNQLDQSVLDELEIDPTEDTAVIPYSSGTTGFAKAVELTHRNMVAIYIVYDAYEILDLNSCMYSDRPMYHALGYGMALISIMVGSKLVVDKKFNLRQVMEAISSYKVTHMCTVPPNLIHLVNAEGYEEYDTSSLRSVLVSAASTAPDVIRKFAEKFKVMMTPGYGATETFFIAISKDPEEALQSAGTVCPTVEVKILDLTNHEECPSNEDGEIVVRGPQVMKSYVANQSEACGLDDNGIDPNGWFGTGDIGHFDRFGNLYIVDRLREMIKYKGLQVSPTELEGVLVSHPKVADAGVIGVPDPIDGEIPMAYIVKKDQSLTEDEINSFVKEHLVGYKQLRGGVHFISEIPKSPPGKILRKDLRKLAGL